MVGRPVGWLNNACTDGWNCPQTNGDAKSHCCCIGHVERTAFRKKKKKNARQARQCQSRQEENTHRRRIQKGPVALWGKPRFGPFFFRPSCVFLVCCSWSCAWQRFLLFACVRFSLLLCLSTLLAVCLFVLIAVGFFALLVVCLFSFLDFCFCCCVLSASCLSFLPLGLLLAALKR